MVFQVIGDSVIPVNVDLLEVLYFNFFLVWRKDNFKAKSNEQPVPAANLKKQEICWIMIKCQTALIV